LADPDQRGCEEEGCFVAGVRERLPLRIHFIGAVDFVNAGWFSGRSPNP
jgi:hypothetical protein